MVVCKSAKTTRRPLRKPVPKGFWLEEKMSSVGLCMAVVHPPQECASVRPSVRPDPPKISFFKGIGKPSVQIRWCQGSPWTADLPRRLLFGSGRGGIHQPSVRLCCAEDKRARVPSVFTRGSVKTSSSRYLRPGLVKSVIIPMKCTFNGDVLCVSMFGRIARSDVFHGILRGSTCIGLLRR